MSTTTTARTVATALAEVARWRTDEEARAKAEKVEVEQEIRNLHTAIQNLQAQLDALHKFGAELDGKKSALAAQELERSHAAVLGALQSQARGVGLRDQEVGRSTAAREAALAERLRDPSMAASVEEYRQFKGTVEPTIAALPESYRKVILQHHETVSARVRDAVRQVYEAPLGISGEAVDCEVVWAVDAPEGVPELLVCILPVSDQVHSHWHDQDEGVQLWLASRVVQALYEAAAATGYGRIHAMAGGHEGLLVLETDLSGASPKLVDEFAARLGNVIGQAREIGGVGVKASAVRVEMDVLLPPQGEEDGDVG
jgi:Skp family chaperone for outer membrane proteins